MGQDFTIFEYYGQYTYDFNNLEPVINHNDMDDERIPANGGITDQ